MLGIITLDDVIGQQIQQEIMLLLLTGGAYPGVISMNRHLIFREAMRSTTLGHAIGSFGVRLLSMYCQCDVCFNRKAPNVVDERVASK